MPQNPRMVKKECEQCGNQFSCRASLPEKQGRFCSRSCSGAHLKGSHRRPRGAKNQLTCSFCKGVFFAKAGKYPKTCSESCKRQLLSSISSSPENINRISAIGKKVLSENKYSHPDKVHHLRNKTCAQCQKEFTIRRGYSSTTVERIRFCSRECWNNYVRDDPTRMTSFKGGRYPYYGANWKSQADKARERDNHTCQICGIQQTKPLLCVHHLKPRRDCDNWKIANHLSNLVTLCRSCHRIVENEKNRIQKKCGVCDKVFFVSPCHSTQKYCSFPCACIGRRKT